MQVFCSKNTPRTRYRHSVVHQRRLQWFLWLYNIQFFSDASEDTTPVSEFVSAFKDSFFLTIVDGIQLILLAVRCCCFRFAVCSWKCSIGCVYKPLFGVVSWRLRDWWLHFTVWCLRFVCGFDLQFLTWNRLFVRTLLWTGDCAICTHSLWIGKWHLLCVDWEFWNPDKWLPFPWTTKQ